MLKARTFKKGGVHPSDKKELTEKSVITDFPLSDTLCIPFSQHLGAPANPIISKGDTLYPGQKIGEASSFISAHIHTPAGGEVKEIKDIFLPNGLKVKSAVLKVDKEQKFSIKKTGDKEIENSEPSDLIEKVKEAGIVGMGGATFPAHVKFKIPKGKSTEYLLINGVECEPYLNSDNRLMLEKTEELLKGVQYIRKMTGAQKVIIGIEKNKPESIQRISEVIEKNSYDISVQPLKVRYPQGDEKQLIKAAVGREVPSGGLPIDIGAVVVNVGTTFAVYEALSLGKPLFERIVTVSGEAIQNPGNYKVTVGTTFKELIDACGGFSKKPEKIVAGGPMMGFAVYDLDTPVIKGTSGILALTKEQISSSVQTACISCGRCVRGCPMGLNPSKLFKVIDSGDYEEAKAMHLLDCKECGCCSYSCPAKIPLVQGMRLGKRMLRKMQ
ncbi:MAG: electron transport complex subunit RsxC [Spirochaetia bacterium]|nr:electron transport complex subunit RsxC [Spirochaetia bacterium]MCF7946759.1 electron transport complex subunit RsxC [Spirochaetia bacterium]